MERNHNYAQNLPKSLRWQGVASEGLSVLTLSIEFLLSCLHCYFCMADKCPHSSGHPLLSATPFLEPGQDKNLR